MTATPTAPKAVPCIAVEQFGKDHWSTLAYIETCCVDAKGAVGQLDRARMRANPATHPMLANGAPWRPEYATRLAGFFDHADRIDHAKAVAAGIVVPDHDDWDCVNDLEAAGFIDVISLVNPAVKLTEQGLQVTNALRSHKARGGHFATFVWTHAPSQPAPSPKP